MKRKALITGITGQDGSYLAELLLEKEYEVHGMVRRVAIEDPEHRMSRIYHILEQLHLHAASLESMSSIYKVLHEVRPDECYHLGAQSFVSHSFQDEFSTLNTNINGTHYLLSGLHDVVPDCRFYFAASSEMFGNAPESPQKEQTPLMPRSSYGISKVAGYHLTRNYREAYGLRGWCGILYNHESPRRGHEFVTRKITSQVARIKAGISRELRLGNLDASRDWGHAREYVHAMWLMLQQDNPEDFVVATGQSHTVRDFLAQACDVVNLNYEEFLVIDQQLLRPSEIHLLVGDSTKAERTLGWKPKVTFEDLVREMIETDLHLLTRTRKYISI